MSGFASEEIEGHVETHAVGTSHKMRVPATRFRVPDKSRNVVGRMRFTNLRGFRKSVGNCSNKPVPARESVASSSPKDIVFIVVAVVDARFVFITDRSTKERKISSGNRLEERRKFANTSREKDPYFTACHRR